MYSLWPRNAEFIGACSNQQIKCISVNRQNIELKILNCIPCHYHKSLKFRLFTGITIVIQQVWFSFFIHDISLLPFNRHFVSYASQAIIWMIVTKYLTYVWCSLSGIFLNAGSICMYHLAFSFYWKWKIKETKKTK